MTELKPGCVYVADNFLEHGLLENVERTVHGREIPWYYRSVSNDYEDGTRFWGKLFCYNEPSFVVKDNDITQYNYKIINTDLVNYIKKIIGNDIKVIRIHANGQTYHQNGAWHVDSEVKNQNIFACLIYLTPGVTKDNVSEYGGYTLIKTNESMLSIEPVHNRAVFFDANLLHRGLCFEKSKNDLRITLNVLFKVLK